MNMLLPSWRLALHHEELKRWSAPSTEWSICFKHARFFCYKVAHPWWRNLKDVWDKVYASFQVYRVIIHNHYISFPAFCIWGTNNLVTSEINRVKKKTFISPSNKPLGPKGGAGVQFHSFSNLGATWGPVINATHRRFCPRDRDPIPMVQKAGWGPGPVWTGAENLATTGIR